VNNTGKLNSPLVTFAVKLATGANGVTLTHEKPGVVLLPPSFVAFNLILQLPTPNVYTGDCDVLKVTAVLLPVTFVKFHAQLVGRFVEESVNNTVVGAVPLVTFCVKDATGVALVTVM
jgi:hypothetical protein